LYFACKKEATCLPSIDPQDDKASWKNCFISMMPGQAGPINHVKQLSLPNQVFDASARFFSKKQAKKQANAIWQASDCSQD